MLCTFQCTNYENSLLFVWIEPICFSEELLLNDSIEVMVKCFNYVDYQLIEYERDVNQLNIFINNEISTSNIFNIKIIKNSIQIFEIDL